MTDVSPLTLAAATAAGPIQHGQESTWLARVKQIAVDLVIVDRDIRERCELLAKIQKGHDPAKGGTKGWAVVRGTLRKVEVEERSKRGLLTFDAYDSRSSQVEVDSIRTDFVSDVDAKAMVEYAKTLIGHEIDLYKYQAPMAGNAGQTVKMLAHIVDRGVAGQQGHQSGPAGPSEAPRQEATAPAERQQAAPAAPAPTSAPAPTAPAPTAPTAPAAPAAAPAAPPAGEGGWPEVAAPPSGEMLSENAAKTYLMDALGGDPATARSVWAALGSPKGADVLVTNLDRAIEDYRRSIA